MIIHKNKLGVFKRFILKVFFCAFTTFAMTGVATAGNINLIKEGSFEALRSNKMPNGPSWAWSNNGSKQLQISLSHTEKHSGKYSLHLVDTDRGHTNDGLRWMMAGNQLSRYAGKKLELSCWIKQLRSSSTKKVGVRYWIKCKSGKIVSGFAGPEITGETLWTRYSLQIAIPDDPQLFLIFIYCANGWGNDAEAFFDDLMLTPAKAVKPTETQKATGQESKSPVLSGDKKAFYFFRNAPLPLWQKRYWGGLYLEHNQTGGSCLKVATTKGAKAFSGIGLRCPFSNRMAELPLAGSRTELFFSVKPFSPMQVQLGGRTVKVTGAMKNRFNDGWTMVRIPLESFSKGGNSILTNIISFQFLKRLPAGSIILFGPIGVSGLAERVDIKKIDPVIKPKAEELCRGLDRVWTTDQYRRPEIRNGTFYMGGKPVFMLGPWIDNTTLSSNYGPSSIRECMRGTIYDRMFCPAVAAELGKNSLQLSAAASLPYLYKLDLPWGKPQIKNAETLGKMIRGLKGMPFIQDYAWINKVGRILKRESPANRELMQKNPGWHEFIPLCPENPRAVDIYSNYFRTGAAFTLANGGNPFIYEIFNESSYQCSCKFNRSNFTRRMAVKFRDITNANRLWHTSFRSFSDLTAIPHYETYPAVWAEWCKFLAQRYAEALRKFGNEIKKVDQRPNVYLTEQPSTSTIFTSRGAGMDYRLIAGTLDVLTTEGGWKFGQAMITGSGDPMEDAMNSSGYSFIADFFSALSHGRKPVVNNEHYCTRSLFGKRAPSKNTDMITAMWGEVFHGTSGSFPYSWGKRVWEWKNFAEAKALVYNGGYKAALLLNPYSWPREALDGFKQFSDELKQLAAIALPQPRRAPAKVALVYSYPSLRMSKLNHEDIEKQLLNSYFSLLYSQYSPEIVFAEDMTVASLRRFDAVVLPAIRNADKKTIKTLRDYASVGGVVTCAGKALSENEYAQPLDASALLGVRRNRSRTTRLSAEKTALGWCNKIGKGSVYYLEKTFEDPMTASTIPKILEANKTERYFSIRPLDGKPLYKAEMQLIDRGSVKLLLLVNWADKGSRLATLKYEGKAKLDGVYVSSPVKHELHLNGQKQQWGEAALRRGITVLLPPQTRVLLLLSSSAPAKTDRQVTSAEIKARFKTALAAEAKKRAVVKRKETAMSRERYKARNYTDVKPDHCSPVDLSRYVNTGFQDKVEGDRHGGWFDQGTNDYRKIPHGLVKTAGGVPFRIIDPAANRGCGAIVLRGAERPYFAKSVKGIKVGIKAGRIYILHTAGWSQKLNTPCYYLKVNYSDGSRKKVPVLFGRDIGGWWSPKPLPNAKIAQESSNLACKHIGLYCYRWNNPHPDREIKSLDFECGQDNAVPAIVAITAEQ